MIGHLRPVMSGSVPKLGAWAWSFVGCVVATIVVVTALAAVSEIVLPLLFAAVLAVVWYEQHPRDGAPPMESAPTDVPRARGPAAQPPTETAT